ncbi:unnamed protein product [Rotaria sp. Silwood1]|nr:unnamed protein product [Rotaria sp. Silwood1]
MNLPLPPANRKIPILVWAGSTSVGQYAIQLVKAAECFVITTASPARHSYLKELGADICFDYMDSNVASQIKQATTDSLAYAFDCISEKETVKKVCATFTDKNSQIVTVLPGRSNEVSSHVREHNVLMYTIFGREMHIFRKDYKVKPQDKEFAEKFYKLLSNALLLNGFVKPNKVTKMPNGLNGVKEGFKRMMENKV